jgi:lipopolysaccharide transport system permease protein
MQHPSSSATPDNKVDITTPGLESLQDRTDKNSSSLRKPEVSIRSEKGWTGLGLAQLWQYRELLWTFGGRDVKLRYRQTALGVLWVVLQPLLAAGIFAVIFGKIARLSSENYPYFLYAYAGLLGWNLFSGTLLKASNSLLANSGLVSKVYFPRLLLPLSTTLSTLIDFGVALVMMAGLMILYRVVPGTALLWMPLWVLMLLMIAVGVGFFTAALTVSYRDVNYILPVLVNLLLYASPVAYSLTEAVSRLSEGGRRLDMFFALNPLSGLLEAMRWSLLNTTPPSPGYLAYSFVFSIVSLLGGAFVFKRMERKFADVI